MSDKKTDEQIHYESVISFIKWTLSITGIILALFTTIVTIVIGNNISDIRKDAKENLDTISAQFKSTIELTKENLGYLKEITDKRIEILKLQTENLAIEETKKRVENAFRDNNIQYLLEETAKSELEPKIKKITNEKVADITGYYSELTEFLPKAILAVDQIRNGYRVGLDTLFSIINRSQGQEIKKFAEQLLKEKSKDWYGTAFDYFKDKDLKKQLDVLKIKSENPFGEKSLIVSELIKIINTDQDLERISFAFLTLELVTNKKLNMFDITNANKIAKSSF